MTTLMEEKAAKKKAAEVAYNNIQKRLILDMNKVFGSDAGVRVLRHIMKECGYQLPGVAFSRQSEEICPLNTIYDGARRNVYLQIRKYLSPKVLIPVEIEAHTSPKPITKKETKNARRSNNTTG